MPKTYSMKHFGKRYTFNFKIDDIDSIKIYLDNEFIHDADEYDFKDRKSIYKLLTDLIDDHNLAKISNCGYPTNVPNHE